ncbi:MAG: HAD-IA family hydrolase [Planctomycetes bacterium]|nr:HAD-IA family hydrolase [Planctomycetota bacterium]
MTSLQAIFFDVDDTLYSTSEFAAKARKRSMEAMVALGVKMPVEELERELEEVIAEFSSNYEHHFDKLLLRIPRKAWEGLNRAVLIAGAIVAYHETKSRELVAYPDAAELLRKLAKTSLVRGVITSGLEIKQAEKLVRLQVLDFLSPGAIFISDQIGISKPNRKLYMRACDSLGVSPKSAMYVGDHPLHDIDPANAIGMATVLVKRGGRHSGEVGRTKATHEVKEFGALEGILKKEYGVPLV